jgi:hypothetical protein
MKQGGRSDPAVIHMSHFVGGILNLHQSGDQEKYSHRFCLNLSTCPEMWTSCDPALFGGRRKSAAMTPMPHIRSVR